MRSEVGPDAAVGGAPTATGAGVGGRRELAAVDAGASSLVTVAGSAGQPTAAAPPANVGGSTGAGAPGAGAAAVAGRASAAGSSVASTAGAQSGRGGAGAAGNAAALHACPTDGAPCKLMPFGDSITDGYNQDTPGGYRVELFRLAHAAGKNVTFVGSGSNGPEKVDGAAFPHNHEGHSGWTIAPAGGRSGISTLVPTVMPQFAPHIVLLMIGTNDAIDNYDMAHAPDRLAQLIDAVYAQLPSVVILVAQLIPARGDTGQGDDGELSARIRRLNEAIPSVVKARADAGKRIFVVDMYRAFEGAERSLLEDQWHPNAAGYVKLGAQWYAALQPLL